SADMSSGERAAFVVTGLVETLLFVVSCLGFVGAIVRKQLFLRIYAYFLYVHFVLNIGVAAYLLYVVAHFSANATAKACQSTIENEQAKSQCTGLLKVATGVYVTVTTLVLLIELYVALVVTRYLNQIRNEKQDAHLYNEEAFELMPKTKARYEFLPDGGNTISRSHLAVYSGNGPDFDPYGEVDTSKQEGRRRRSEHCDVNHPEEDGYGGGSWTHSQITYDEKARMKLEEQELDAHEERAKDAPSWMSPSFPIPRAYPPDPELPAYISSSHNQEFH
ncbi:hypothetical protein H0H93_007346, partial [Arthromyces matolae]